MESCEWEATPLTFCRQRLDQYALGSSWSRLRTALCDKKSEQIANKAGIKFIMNRCPKIEYAKFSGELGWAGINSNIISNKRFLYKNG